ncbi:hypothetical protein ACFLU5_08240 [Bacteroidota bacterium]
MKKWILLAVIPFIGVLGIISSCNTGDEIGEDDTFNLDTLAIKPSTIDENFTAAWGVTTTGYPLFFIDIYLSEDNILGSDDLLIGTTSSADLSNEVTFDEEQYFRIEAIAGSANAVFLHNEKTADINDDKWKVSEQVLNPSGTSQYIIGDCYHTSGLVIEYGRKRRLAVPVTFN